MIPILDLEKIYSEYEMTFQSSQISKEQVEIIKRIDEIIQKLDTGDASGGGFNSWTIDQLILAKQKLDRYADCLSEYITFHQSRSNFAYAWRKFEYAGDWQPMKTALKNETSEKVTDTTIKMSLDKKFAPEHFYSLFHRTRADFLLMKIDSINKHSYTISDRVRELQRQFRANELDRQLEVPQYQK